MHIRFPVIFHTFYEYCIRQETKVPHIIKILLKTFGKGSYKTFPVGTRSKTSFLTSTTAVDIQQIWNMQKQPFRNVLRKTCSEYIQKIYKRTPMVKCNLNKTLLQLCWNCPSPHVFSCKVAACFQQSTFSSEYIWRDSSEDTE